ncbi:hypothetical protein [Pedobacter puniceum]|uniref:Bulb-type lectin domain-containing protein n=1 Tax=Pedobacter puniceum TaxID=2666136 RepID=A0A7K0FN28_9SPHI|nr:hypothetical protein [Pedobacter puniceum]MRX47389.1 hypothetical protein [Pedobacter puniceum]
MKIKFLFIVAIAVSTLTACSKEDVEVTKTTSNEKHSSSRLGEKSSLQETASTLNSVFCFYDYYTGSIPGEWNYYGTGPVSAPSHYSTCSNSILRFAGSSFNNGYNIRTELNTNETLYSPNGVYRLVMQGDGNLVLYNSANSAIWRSGSVSGAGNYSFRCQSDGNLVIYKNPISVYSPGTPIWNASTNPTGLFPGQPQQALLILQDDGNLVFYYPDNTNLSNLGTSYIIASTGTAGGKRSSHNGKFRSPRGYTYTY